jgi:hypothetical protein
LKTTAAFQAHISFWLALWRGSDGSPKHNSEHGQDWQSSQFFTVARVRASVLSDHPTAIATQGRYCDGLRMSGPPEE